MIQLAMVAVPPSQERIKAISQVGATEVIYYTMGNESDKFEGISEFVAQAKAHDLRVTVVESGPAIDKIVMGLPGWQEQTDQWICAIKMLSGHGVEVICYNFMPQISDDAMVIRTSFDSLTRGGAKTSAYRAADVSPAHYPHDLTPISRDEVRENLARFPNTVTPVAEECGIKLAMHPDDPPKSPMGGLHRIMSSIEDYEWLLDVCKSPANGITFCIGCFEEMECDLPVEIEKFKDRIYFVHFRNIKGNADDFVETFPDDGDIDLAGVMGALKKAGYKGSIRPDHAPEISGEKVEMDGYGFQGHLFTLGYMRGLLHAVAS